MSHISERILVKAPLATAAGSLAVFMVANRTHHGDGAHITLHGEGMFRPAITVLAAAQQPADLSPRYNVFWVAEGTGIFPVFNGVLWIDGDADDDAFWLVISGDYRAPRGSAATHFDDVAGNRTASATAQELLVNARDAIEDAFGDEAVNS